MNIRYEMRVPKDRLKLMAIDILVRKYYGGATKALTSMLENEKIRIIKENPEDLKKWIALESKMEEMAKD